MAKRETGAKVRDKRSAGSRQVRTAIVGARVRDLRDRRQWSQPELAYRSGLHPTDISLLENGRKDVVTARFLRLVVALDTSADYLLGLTDMPGRAR